MWKKTESRVEELNSCIEIKYSWGRLAVERCRRDKHERKKAYEKNDCNNTEWHLLICLFVESLKNIMARKVKGGFLRLR